MRPLSEFPAWSPAARCNSASGCRRPPGATVYLKREDLQAVRSYKLRGAHNLLMQLSDDEIAAGVVCSSAGNHAQGFAMACRSMGIHGRVYVPAKTPKQKRDRIRYHGRDFIELIAGRQDLRRGRRRGARRRRADRRDAGAAVRRSAHDGRPGHHRRRDSRPARRRAGPGDRPGRWRRLHRRHHDVSGRADDEHLGARRRAGRGRGDDRRAGRGRAGHAGSRRPVRRRRGGRTGRAR